MAINNFENYEPSVVNKVKRLFMLLNAFNNHPTLKDNYALFGGTAINLFLLDVPRLSVDIDISYIGDLRPDHIREDRQNFEEALVLVGQDLGYNVAPNKGGHAGRSFILNYTDQYGKDTIKIDSVYLNRIPLMPINKTESILFPGIKVNLLNEYELIGGKVKAFLSRVKIRDLYDIANLYDLYKDNNDPLFKKILFFNACVSASFPFGFKNREERFIEISNALETELYPMLKAEEHKPSIEELTEKAKLFINKFLIPSEEDEINFYDKFKQGIYEPELLFTDDKIINNAKRNPSALWKLNNLQKLIKDTK